MASYFERAQLLYEQHRFDLAIQELHQALAIDLEDTSCHKLLALCLAQQQYLAAIDPAIHLAPNQAKDFGCMNLRLMVLMQLGQLPKAEANIQFVLAAPDNYVAHAVHG